VWALSATEIDRAIRHALRWHRCSYREVALVYFDADPADWRNHGDGTLYSRVDVPPKNITAVETLVRKQL